MPSTKDGLQEDVEGALTIIPAEGDGPTYEIEDRLHRGRGARPPLEPVNVPKNAPSIEVEGDDDSKPKTVVRFKESEDLLEVAISFEIPNYPPFSIKLINMSWQLMEDIDYIQHASEDERNITMLTDFFHEYVQGGPRAVPIGHTGTVFNCIRAYMTYKSDSSLKN